MKLVTLVLILCSCAFALTDYTVPYTITDGDTFYDYIFNRNFDTIEVNDARLKDSIDIEFSRFSDFEGGDSTLSRIQLDTIRSNPDVDTVLGKPYVDTIETDYIDVADSLKVTGHVKVTQDVEADSIIGITGGIITNTLSVDSLDASGDINTAGNLDAATVNTGQGDNELYDMDQNVLTTSEVIFDTTRTTACSTGILRLGSKNLTANNDDFDVSGVGVVYVDPTSAHITLGGLQGGVAGQVVLFVRTVTNNNFTVEFDEGAGTQDIITCSGGDMGFTNYGGFTLVSTGTVWFMVDCEP